MRPPQQLSEAVSEEMRRAEDVAQRLGSSGTTKEGTGGTNISPTLPQK